MSQLSLPAPPCMESINDLVKTVIDVTKIKPKSFQVPTAINHQVITVKHDIPLDPPPTGPFTITINDPIFGPIQLPVFVPVETPPELPPTRRKRKGKKPKYKKSHAKKQNIPNKLKRNESTDLSPECRIQISLQAVLNQPKVQKHIQQVSFEHSINEVLIYFKSVEDKIKKVLERTLGNLSRQNLEDLSSLTKDLRYLLEELEKLYVENDLSISEIQELEQFQKVLEYADRLSKLFNGLTNSSLSELLEHTVDKREEHMLCSILGLEDEIADMLISLDTSQREHQTDEQWIYDILDQKETELDGCEEKDQIFRKLGFSSAKSVYLTKVSNENAYSDHLTFASWAKKYIENQFKYNILLSPDSYTFNPYNNESALDTEYNVETIDDETEEPVQIKAIDTKKLNPDELEKSDLLAEFLSQDEDSLNGVKYWFHGTDHKSALNIMENPIDLSKGKQGGDFSDGNGFYLTSNFKFAYEWSGPKFMKKANTAVVVFKLPENDAVFTEERKGKNFEEACDDWKKTVNFFRKKKDYKLCGRKKGQELVRAPYIFGPISKDGAQSKTPSWDPKPRKPRVYQICIKDDLMAEDLKDSGRNIYKTIFFH